MELGVVTCTLEPGPQPDTMTSKTTDKTKKLSFFISLPPEAFIILYLSSRDHDDLIDSSPLVFDQEDRAKFIIQ